ncbi:phosphatidylethanolamine N-methyltransferase /phosphatidyl-N-methylethanolamine N-methyltransferase [Murinocardiopsis flavida]|uniref:Phosphatidylethanolamine N-methyltransferase /phosphatidyl-N-methylethanolamine N-methyltransferase n=1 Tax=Murinocardiopsis flavida TaxID=645275 RepID=A0A2P8DUM3_9ACTN|nr:class I SAM-dependent methyltransferase [Murinocardiopsis flavida]PSL00884.1 phosphatidylethanolamine N-methyltransferase /phosphatidyl-N-methylethanolamine N-methyltransferase [Murinocardiopsis flavida]
MDRSSSGPNDRIRRHWDRQAARYDAAMDRLERLVFADGRSWVCSQASGRTLEVAVGTGRNLPLYPPDVELTGIDLSPRMLDIARERARRDGHAVDLREADAQDLPFPDEHFDTVVSTLSLCSVLDLDATVAEMRRVLRPGGRLVLLDHVRPSVAPVRWALTAVQWLMNRLDPGNGEQLLRRPLTTVRAHGFAVERRERSKAGAVERLAARRPAEQ